MKPVEYPIYRALARAYGPVRRPAGEDPIDVLVRTILSQNTSDTNSDSAYRLLRRRFPKWDEVVNADPRVLSKTISCGGLANIKAERIIKTLKTVNAREGGLKLDTLKMLNTPEALSYLTTLPGVGVKTACCVLLFAFGRPVMPVDTHVLRVARRLGLVESQTAVDEVHERLERMIPKHRILPMHLYLIRHGRQICRARNPLCQKCPVSSHCAFFARNATVLSA